MMYYKFVEWEPQPIEKVLTDKIPAALAEYDNGNRQLSAGSFSEEVKDL